MVKFSLPSVFFVSHRGGEEAYNLNGTRVANPKHGLYMIDGKKGKNQIIRKLKYFNSEINRTFASIIIKKYMNYH